MGWKLEIFPTPKLNKNYPQVTFVVVKKRHKKTNFIYGKTGPRNQSVPYGIFNKPRRTRIMVYKYGG
jgi:hypothetical protein